jgi:hypothetical protein
LDIQLVPETHDTRPEPTIAFSNGLILPRQAIQVDT